MAKRRKTPRTRQAAPAANAFWQNSSTIQALLESAAQAILAVNEAGKIVLANGMTEKMFGYPRKELLGHPLDLLIPENLRNRHRAHHGEFFANARSRPMRIGLDLHGRRKDRTLFPVEISLNSMDTANGRLGVAFVTDITERKRLEAARKQDHEQIRALALRLMTAQDEERRRLSREIHDDFCQELAALAFDLGEVLSTLVSAASQGVLQQLQDRLTDLSVAARNLAYQLHPSILEDLGLSASVRALCDEFSQRNGVVVKFNERRMADRLPVEVMSCLYRITQESLRNAFKHSGAKQIAVTLSSDEKAVQVSIREDGAGFDLRSARRNGGLGLANMQERIRLVDGSLSIQSAAGQGTRIVATARLARGE